MASMPYCSASTPVTLRTLKDKLAPEIFHTEERKSTDNFRFITPIFCDDMINHDKSMRRQKTTKLLFFSLKNHSIVKYSKISDKAFVVREVLLFGLFSRRVTPPPFTQSVSQSVSQ